MPYQQRRFGLLSDDAPVVIEDVLHPEPSQALPCATLSQTSVRWG